MSSHLTMVANPCDAFYHGLTWICEIESSSNVDDWGPLVTAASISSGVQSRPTETGHTTRAYCSNKFSARYRLTLHLGNMRPHNFSSMNPSGPVNSSSNRLWSSANAFADPSFHQCCGTLSRFGVVCTASANALDSRCFLWFAPGRECTSDLCLKFNARNCGWSVRIKSIGLARIFY